MPTSVSSILWADELGGWRQIITHFGATVVKSWLQLPSAAGIIQLVLATATNFLCLCCDIVLVLLYSMVTNETLTFSCLRRQIGLRGWYGIMSHDVAHK